MSRRGVIFTGWILKKWDVSIIFFGFYVSLTESDYSIIQRLHQSRHGIRLSGLYRLKRIWQAFRLLVLLSASALKRPPCVEAFRWKPSLRSMHRACSVTSWLCGSSIACKQRVVVTLASSFTSRCERGSRLCRLVWLHIECFVWHLHGFIRSTRISVNISSLQTSSWVVTVTVRHALETTIVK